MLLCWLKIATSGLAALVLTLSANPKNLKLFTPANITAIALASYAGIELRKLEKYYQDKERCEDMLAALKDTQAEEQLQFLSSAAHRKRENEDADKRTQRQLNLLQKTAPLFSEVLNLTGQNGAVERMALGMIQNGEPLGNVLLAASEAEMQLEQAKLQAQIHQRQLELQVKQVQQLKSAEVTPDSVTSTSASTPQIANLSKIDGLKKAATVVGLTTQCLGVDIAPSYERLIFSIRTEDFQSIPKFKAASKLALGISNLEDLPFYIYAPEQIAVEVALKPEDRTYYNFPVKHWNQGSRLIILGLSLDGEVVIDLASEDTPQLLVVGTTGSGKSNFFRAAAYCLLMQGARVDVCGGKVSDYEDFADRFPEITMNDMGNDAREQPSALKTASMVEQNPRIQVVFVNTEEEWLPGNQVRISFGNFQFWNFRLTQLPNFKDWRWWLNLSKANPLILILAGSLFLGVLPELRKLTPATVIQQTQQQP